MQRIRDETTNRNEGNKQEAGVSSSIVSLFYCMHRFHFFFPLSDSKDKEESIPKISKCQWTEEHRWVREKLCNISVWQLVFFCFLYFSGEIKQTNIKQIQTVKIRDWTLRGRQLALSLKYTSVLFTACLLSTAPLTTPMSTHKMDTTFNTSARASALNSLVTVALHRP